MDEDLSQLVYSETLDDGGAVVDRELYELRLDPFQIASRHRNPAYLAKRRRLKQHLDALKSCRDGTCQQLEE